MMWSCWQAGAVVCGGGGGVVIIVKHRNF